MSKIKVKMTIEEITAIYGLLCSVNDVKSEIDVSRIRNLLDEIIVYEYPGYDAIPHWGEGYDCIEIYKD